MLGSNQTGTAADLGNGYRHESPYIIDDAPPRAKRSAFFTITLASIMWWMPIIWVRFLYAPGVQERGLNVFSWTVTALLALLGIVPAVQLIRAVRQGRFEAMTGKLIGMISIALLVCVGILVGWATSSLPISTPLGSSFYFFSAALGVFFLISAFVETIHALRAGSSWGVGYDATSSWRVENSAYMWLWNCFWFLVFYVIFFLF